MIPIRFGEAVVLKQRDRMIAIRSYESYVFFNIENKCDSHRRCRAVQEILLLGDPRLYVRSDEIFQEDLENVRAIVSDLHDTLAEFRKRHNAGRAIAAPQIGVMKRLIYRYADDLD